MHFADGLGVLNDKLRESVVAYLNIVYILAPSNFYLFTMRGSILAIFLCYLVSTGICASDTTITSQQSSPATMPLPSHSLTPISCSNITECLHQQHLTIQTVYPLQVPENNTKFFKKLPVLFLLRKPSGWAKSGRLTHHKQGQLRSRPLKHLFCGVRITQPQETKNL